MSTQKSLNFFHKSYSGQQHDLNQPAKTSVSPRSSPLRTCPQRRRARRNGCFRRLDLNPILQAPATWGGGGAKGGPGGTQQSFIRGSTATPVRGPTPYPSEIQVLTIKVPLSFFQTVPLSTDPVQNTAFRKRCKCTILLLNQGVFMSIFLQISRWL